MKHGPYGTNYNTTERTDYTLSVMSVNGVQDDYRGQPTSHRVAWNCLSLSNNAATSSASVNQPAVTGSGNVSFQLPSCTNNTATNTNDNHDNHDVLGMDVDAAQLRSHTL